MCGQQTQTEFTFKLFFIQEKWLSKKKDEYRHEKHATEFQLFPEKTVFGKSKITWKVSLGHNKLKKQILFKSPINYEIISYSRSFYFLIISNHSFNFLGCIRVQVKIVQNSILIKSMFVLFHVCANTYLPLSA